MQTKIESLDTNIIVRAIIRDIESQYQLVQKLLSRKDVLYGVDETAISETVYVMLKKEYSFSREDIRDSILEFLKLPNISCNYGLAEDELNLFVEHPSFSFDDCCLVVKSALAQSIPLWTFDHKLAAQSPVAKELK